MKVRTPSCASVSGSIGHAAPGAFDEYAREPNALSAQSDPLLALLPGSAWQRRYARFDPWQTPYRTLAYERDSGVATVLVRIYRGVEPPPLSANLKVETPFGLVVVENAARDPALPTLEAVLARHPRARMVRYRPHCRCTLAYSDGDTALFSKVFADQQAGPLIEASQELWRARDQRGFRVATPHECKALKAARAPHPSAPTKATRHLCRAPALGEAVCA